MKKVALYIKEDCSYVELNKYGFEIVRYINKDEFIKSNSNLKIIHEEIEHNERVEIIKGIREIHSKLQVVILNLLRFKDIENLIEYTKLGANEYIKAPYKVEEIYFVLNNNLIKLDKDRKFQLTIDNLTFPTWVNDIQGKYINANQKFANHLKTTSGKLIGKGPEDFYDEDEVNKIMKQDKEIIEKKETIKFNDSYIEDGKKRLIEIHKTPIFNIYNDIVAITGTIVEVTDLKEAQQESARQALTDPLTALSNRRALYEYINKKDKDEEISVILIDIDNFKAINDTYGHHIGDYTIKNIAEKLSSICENNFVCRLGGDEFLVVFKGNNSTEDIINKAKKLCDIKSIKKNENEEYNVTVSIGIAIDQKGNSINDILAKVDIALYKSKEQGKNRYSIYNDELTKEKEIYLEIKKSIKNNNLQDSFKLYYQPQYDINKNIYGLEALLRWENEKYNNIPIGHIIKIMEDKGLIVGVGYFIAKSAFEFTNRINKNRKNPIIVSVNISALQIMHKDFINTIKKLVLDTNVNPKHIGIEITETTLLKDMKNNAVKMEELKAMGMSILIDDFGVGYSSFSYILELPITTIKIDKSITSLIHINKKYKDLITLIVKFTELSDLNTIAEGVEIEEQLLKLKEIGVEYIQGFLLNRPLREDIVVELIKEEE